MKIRIVRGFPDQILLEGDMICSTLIELTTEGIRRHGGVNKATEICLNENRAIEEEK